MGALNQVTIIGNLGQDPEVRYTGAGQAVGNFSVAVNEKWTDKDGQKQERTEWIRIVVWGKQAENCGAHLAKGREVCIVGRLQTREWEDKEGKKNYTTEVVANQVVFLGGGKGDGQRAAEGAPPAGGPDERGGSSGPVFPNYGKAKGQPISGASLQDLEFYAGGARKSLADPAKERWHAKERELLAAIESEIARQQSSGGPSEDDIPF